MEATWEPGQHMGSLSPAAPKQLAQHRFNDVINTVREIRLDALIPVQKNEGLLGKR